MLTVSEFTFWFKLDETVHSDQNSSRTFTCSHFVLGVMQCLGETPSWIGPPPAYKHDYEWMWPIVFRR